MVGTYGARSCEAAIYSTCYGYDCERCSRGHVERKTEFYRISPYALLAISAVSSTSLPLLSTACHAPTLRWTKAAEASSIRRCEPSHTADEKLA